MENPITNYEPITDAKIDYIEAQVLKNFEFRLETMKILSEQAMVTLNWLFALALTPAGYVFSHADKIKWWISIPAILCSLASGLTAIYLFQKALRTKSIFPAGNEPKNLISDAIMAADFRCVRLAELCNLQGRIETVSKLNVNTANSINNARMAIIFITVASLFLLGLLYCISA